jgi:hypothetical protein
MTGTHHHVQLFCWDGMLLIFLPKLTSNCNPLNLCLLTSCDYRHEPLCEPLKTKFLIYYLKLFLRGLPSQQQSKNTYFIVVLYLCISWPYWGLSSEPHTWKVGALLLEPLHQPLFVLDIFLIGCLKLFAQAGLEPQSFWPLPPRIISVSHRLLAHSNYF